MRPGDKRRHSEKPGKRPHPGLRWSMPRRSSILMRMFLAVGGYSNAIPMIREEQQKTRDHLRLTSSSSRQPRRPPATPNNSGTAMARHQCGVPCPEGVVMLGEAWRAGRPRSRRGGHGVAVAMALDNHAVLGTRTRRGHETTGWFQTCRVDGANGVAHSRDGHPPDRHGLSPYTGSRFPL